jgi:hypothetical protein
MIDGVTILATETVEVMHPTLEVIGWLAIPLVFIGLIVFVVGYSLDSMECGLTGLGIVAFSFIMAITSAVVGSYITVPSYNTYEVILDDSVSMNEFMNTYEVLEQRGQIYVVKEIEE